MTNEEGNNQELNKVTIREAREAAGYTKEDVISLIDVTEDELDTYENDATDLPIKLACELLGLYKVASNAVKFRG
ncbi:helix-turn-helix transcriptional regulator [Paenibacillus sp. Marseille-Q4541]|uniref:helix-turn-helix domain-containing protein n=1 Tax=Paenibacillus sp. Marseille-Q4541 TaxID=2831522 RepID=UPI001BAB7B3A|nr:helix-turn-helix transcriptional regulator [Paenibacillus sp. Marseille-Q4541]